MALGVDVVFNILIHKLSPMCRSDKNEFGQITPGNTQKWQYTEPTQSTIYHDLESLWHCLANKKKIPSPIPKEMSSRTSPRPTVRFCVVII